MLMQVSAGRGRGPEVVGLNDPSTSSIQYLASDPATGRCAVIDPVLDYDAVMGSTSTGSADALLDVVRERGFEIAWILDTHPHADHLTAAHYLRERTGAPTATGARVVEMQRFWRDAFGLGSFTCEGSEWDRLFDDGAAFDVGGLACRVISSPGHTLASVTYTVGDAAFVHDTLFMPDAGTARADFPGADPRELWRSIGRILALSDDTRLFSGHDYQPGGREPAWESTVGEQKRSNPHIAAKVDEDAFTALRTARDRTLPLPRLMLPALQVNLAGGRLPAPDGEGRRDLRIPLDAFPSAKRT